MLHPTPADRLCDASGRPYFLWDCDVDLDRLRALLAEGPEEARAYWMGKVMRQAKPDDVLSLMSTDEIRTAWPRVEKYLGRERPFWAWLLARMADLGK